MTPKYTQHNIFNDFYFSTVLKNIDNEKLKTDCYEIEKTYSSKILSNVEGYQSPDLMFVEQKEAGRIEYTKLIEEIESSLLEICGYLEINDVWISNAWLNINRKGGLNVSHSHPKSFFSGVYYVNVESHQPGNFVFERERAVMDYNYSTLYGNNNNEAANLFSTNHVIKPETGLLLIFPSHMLHSVRPNMTETDRISISFNTELAKV